MEDRRSGWQTWLPIAGITVLGAALRFAGLGSQSFWIDEIITVEHVSNSFPDMLRGLPGAESTPPLSYVLAWLWSRAAGTDEAGLRSLSALFGTLTIPVAYTTARTLVTHRVGVIVAALAATSPLLVWYSQEARAYALFVLLGALSFLFFARALNEPSARDLGLWATASSLTLLTHYFGVFLVAAEAALLLYRQRARPTWIATGVIFATGVALLPLAAYQTVHASSRWIRFVELPLRIEESLRQLVVPSAPSIWAGAGVAEDHAQAWWPLALAMLLGAAATVLALGTARERRGGLVALGVGGVVVGAPALASLAAHVVAGGRGDVLLYRNLIVAWLPLAVVVGAALGARRAGRIGVTGAAALTAWSLAVVVHNATTPSLQRDDWRAVARALGEPASQVVILSPSWQLAALQHHLPDARELGGRRLATRRVDLLVREEVPSYSPAVERLTLPPGFDRVETRRVQNWVLTTFRARTPVYLDGTTVGVGPAGSSYVPLARAR